MSGHRVSATIALLFALSCAVPAWAVPILDQQHGGYDGLGLVYVGPDPERFVQWGQTFTVGITGLMTRLDVWIDRGVDTTEDLLWDLRSLDGDAPSIENTGANIIASGSLSAAEVPEELKFIRLTDSLTLPVLVGDMMALTLRSHQPYAGEESTYRWLSGRDRYAGGARYVRTSNSEAWRQGTSDMNFRTWVDPCTPSQHGCSTVSMPLTPALLSFGLLLLTGFRRYFRHNR